MDKEIKENTIDYETEYKRQKIAVEQIKKEFEYEHIQRIAAENDNFQLKRAIKILADQLVGPVS